MNNYQPPNISPHVRLKNFLESVTLHSDGWPKMDELNPWLLLMDIDTTVFHLSDQSAKLIVVKKFATAEFLQPNNLKTYLTKLLVVKDNSLITLFSQILEAVLIGNARVLKPFWTESLTIKSKKLWLPTKTDYPDLGPNSYCTSLTNSTSNSWFSIKEKIVTPKNSLMTSSQLLQSSRQDIMDPGNTVMRARKIRLFLNPEQKVLFKKWLGNVRFVYNQTIAAINDPAQKCPGKFKLRDNLVTNIPLDTPWQKDTPQGVRAGGFSDAYKAFEQGVAKFRKTGIPFTLKYRRKKAESHTMEIPVDALRKDMNLYPRLLGRNSCLLIHKSENEHIKWRTKTVNELRPKLDESGKPTFDEKGKPIKEKTGKVLDKGQILEHSVRIQMTRTGKWYLCVPVEKNVIGSENQGAIIGLDPGVRTFLTGYSPDGYVCKIGDNDFNKLRNYLRKTDTLISQMSKLSSRKKYRHRKALLKRYQNVKNWVKDCHRKTVKHLVDRFDVIIIPEFNSGAMSKRGNRKIGSKTVRSMLTWSHYKFRMMLLSKVEEYRSKVVLMPTEEYTSKTCTRCGTIKSNLGGAKTYHCGKCGLWIDRDINGSRNILMKGLQDLSSGVLSACPTLGPL